MKRPRGLSAPALQPGVDIARQRGFSPVLELRAQAVAIAVPGLLAGLSFSPALDSTGVEQVDSRFFARTVRPSMPGHRFLGTPKRDLRVRTWSAGRRSCRCRSVPARALRQPGRSGHLRRSCHRDRGGITPEKASSLSNRKKQDASPIQRCRHPASPEWRLVRAHCHLRAVNRIAGGCCRRMLRCGGLPGREQLRGRTGRARGVGVRDCHQGRLLPAASGWRATPDRADLDAAPT